MQWEENQDQQEGLVIKVQQWMPEVEDNSIYSVEEVSMEMVVVGEQTPIMVVMMEKMKEKESKENTEECTKFKGGGANKVVTH